jgi:phosphatidylserine/phosphatidylglycerophosphate/cardiolipin synthase-like enzyme
MSHLSGEGISLIEIDLLISECIKANRGQQAFAYLISPFLSDFKIPSKLTHFASNVINASDIEQISDLIGLLVHYGGRVEIVTRSPVDLLNTTINKSFVRKQSRTLIKLAQKKCKIRFNSKLHAKLTVTSQGVVSGSFNLTESGWFHNLEEGSFFQNSTEYKKQYMEKLNWANALIQNSLESTEKDYKDR